MLIQQVDGSEPTPVRMSFRARCGRTVEVTWGGVTFEFACDHDTEPAAPGGAGPGGGGGPVTGTLPPPDETGIGRIAMVVDAGPLLALLPELSDIDRGATPLTVDVAHPVRGVDLADIQGPMAEASRSHRPLRFDVDLGSVIDGSES
jgi:hypothetical protein